MMRLEKEKRLERRERVSVWCSLHQTNSNLENVVLQRKVGKATPHAFGTSCDFVSSMLKHLAAVFKSYRHDEVLANDFFFDIGVWSDVRFESVKELLER